MNDFVPSMLYYYYVVCSQNKSYLMGRNNYYPDIKRIHVTFKLTNGRIMKRFISLFLVFSKIFFDRRQWHLKTAVSCRYGLLTQGYLFSVVIINMIGKQSFTSNWNPRVISVCCFNRNIIWVTNNNLRDVPTIE